MRNWIQLIEQRELFPDYDQQHRSKRFSDWLNGADPRFWYHATLNDFDAFHAKGTGTTSVMGQTYDVERNGIFFARDPDFALEFILDHNGNVKSGGKIIPVYLNVKHTFDLTDSSPRLDQELVDDFAQHGIDIKSVFYHTYEYQRWELFDDDTTFIDALKALGYDSAIMRERTDQASDGTVMVVFDPRNIKSATGNRGSFSPNDDRIIK